MDQQKNMFSGRDASGREIEMTKLDILMVGPEKSGKTSIIKEL